MEKSDKFIIEKRQGCKAVVNGKNVIIFSSNDYLGLSCHSDALKAAASAAKKYGIGTGGAPGTTGTTRIHIELARKIASFKRRQNAILFPSGYQANEAIHQALNSEKTVFHLDKRHHPSANYGARLAKDSIVNKFDHLDLNCLAENLKSYIGYRNVVSLPSVFTVDGDIAPLDKLVELKRRFGIVLILDEAHATGCIGPSGRGLEEHFGLKGAADFIMGTFSKALGSQGGFLAFNDESGKHLQQGSKDRFEFRAAEYSTSLSTISAAAALKSLQIISTSKSRLNSLKKSKALIIENCLKRKLPIVTNDSMILLLPVSSAEAVQDRLFKSGYLTITVKARIENDIRSCLRIVPMALHTPKMIKGFVDALAETVMT